MMKKVIKKLLAALLAVAMLCAMAVPAFAVSNTHTLTINGTTSGHTYKAYQVFAGKLAENGVLSDITFGTGVDGAALLADTSLPSELRGKGSAAELASALVGKENDSELLNDFAKVISMHLATVAGISTGNGTTYTISGLADGYYFIKDATTVNLPNGATYSRYMLNIVADASIAAKDTSVTLTKQIKHNESDTWGTVGDNQIGDTVYFRTISTVPNTKGYSSYTYEIHDKMDSQITSNVVNGNTNNVVAIHIGTAEGTELPSNYYTVTATGNDFTITVDVKAAQEANLVSAGDELYTTFSGVLNESALVAPDGHQDNKAWLKYSNNPNDTSSTGETPESVVHDWTFQINVTKVDGTTKAALKGAQFVLSKNGDLKVADMLDENDTLTNTADLIKLVKSGDTYTIARTSTTDTTFVMTTPENGAISIKGLDDATEYYLYEIVAPSCYNSLTAPIKVVVTTRADTDYSDAGHTLSEVKVTVNGSVSGTSFNVENNLGTTLPSTGGMGTTLFYVVGGGLMVAAIVLLVTKKRMENK